MDMMVRERINGHAQVKGEARGKASAFKSNEEVAAAARVP
jgi:hypothetical protein